MPLAFERSFRNLERKARPGVVLPDSILVAEIGPLLSGEESIFMPGWKLAIEQILTADEDGIQSYGMAKVSSATLMRRGRRNSLSICSSTTNWINSSINE